MTDAACWHELAHEQTDIPAGMRPMARRGARAGAMYAPVADGQRLPSGVLLPTREQRRPRHNLDGSRRGASARVGERGGIRTARVRRASVTVHAHGERRPAALVRRVPRGLRGVRPRVRERLRPAAGLLRRTVPTQQRRRCALPHLRGGGQACCAAADRRDACGWLPPQRGARIPRGGPEHGLVAAGLAITTIAPVTLDVLPDGVTPVAVRGEPQETRRIVLARLPGPLEGPAAAVDALIAALPA